MSVYSVIWARKEHE
jgi:uncharacterized membrane protein YfcA